MFYVVKLKSDISRDEAVLFVYIHMLHRLAFGGYLIILGPAFKYTYPGRYIIRDDNNFSEICNRNNPLPGIFKNKWVDW